MTLAIGVDLGGTRVRAGVVDESGTVLRRTEARSNADDPPAICDAIVRLVRELDAPDVLGVGVGAAGLVDFEAGYYKYGPNLGLRDIALAKTLSERLGTRVLLDNDANVAAWGEHRFGAGRGTRHMLCVTLGTGIGGGIVIDGRPYRGAHGGAAEIGHMLVDPNGPMCGCGRHGCWEQMASGKALERMGRERLPGATSSLLYKQTDGDAARLEGPMVTDAARAGDALARQILDEFAVWVGWGLASLVNILEPERIVIAGGLVDDWDLLAPSAIRAMRERMEASGYRTAPDVIAAELGQDAGIVGAALLLWEG